MFGVWRRDGNVLIPVSTEAREALTAVKDKATCVADVRGARNPKFAALFWVLCQLVADADDDTKLNVKRWLLHKLGYVDIWFEKSGRMHMETQSIAFESMDAATFKQFFDAAVRVMAGRLRTAPEDIQARFDELVNRGNR